MDEDIRFLLERMDTQIALLREQSKKDFDLLTVKIDGLTGFKNKLWGMAVGAGGLGHLIMEMILRK